MHVAVSACLRLSHSVLGIWPQNEPSRICSHARCVLMQRRANRCQGPPLLRLRALPILMVVAVISGLDRVSGAMRLHIHELQR